MRVLTVDAIDTLHDEWILGVPAKPASVSFDTVTMLGNRVQEARRDASQPENTRSMTGKVVDGQGCLPVAYSQR